MGILSHQPSFGSTCFRNILSYINFFIKFDYVQVLSIPFSHKTRTFKHINTKGTKILKQMNKV